MQSVFAEPALAYAGLGRRIVAKIIDWVIVAFLNQTFHYALAGHTPLARDTFESTITLTAMLFSLAYNVGFLERFGATPGKLLLGIKVVRKDGEPLGTGRAFARPLAEFLSFIICYVGYLFAFFDRERRALHDHIAGTRVVLRA
jgi:uncharacterized RDD family membrane protein YckC